MNTIRKTGRQIYQESIKFVPSTVEACKAEPFTAVLQPNGERIEIQMQSSRSLLIIEKVNPGLIKRTYITSEGKSMSDSIAIPEKYRDSFTAEEKSKSISSTLCKVAKSACDVLGVVTGLGALANLAGVGIAGSILVANPATAPVAALVALAGSVACFAMFGGVPPILSALGNFFKAGTTFGEILDGMNKGLNIFSGVNIPAMNVVTGGENFSFGFDKDLEFFSTLRKGLGCEDDSEQPPSPPPVVQVQTNQTGSSYGDPHIVTFDGYRYSFQTIGEFTLVKSVDGSFEVQTRQSPVLNAQLSMNSAVAIKAGNSRIAIYGQGLPDGDSSTPIRVDGRPFPVQGGTLPNGTAIVQQGQGSYVVQLPTGEVISARRIQRNNLSYMDINPSVPSSRQYIGLLGNANGNPADDLQMRNGQIIETKQTYGQIAQTAGSFIPGLGRISGLVGKVENLVFDRLYREFGNSWRIGQAESLFDYKPGQSTETFTDRGFPSSYKTLSMLSAAQIEAATTACRQANVPTEQLEGCIFDVGFTGDTGFAQTASEALGLIQDIGKLIPGGIPIPKQIPLPIRIPGLPF